MLFELFALALGPLWLSPAHPAHQGDYPTAVAESASANQTGAPLLAPQRPRAFPPLAVERLNAGVPWPRGIVVLEDGSIVVVSRGRHRNYGGPAQDYEDHGGTLWLIDPTVSEPYAPGSVPGEAILANQTVLAAPDPGIVHVFDRSKPPVENVSMNRPYCTLAYDAASRNLVFCAYSGIDMGEAPFFRKNATDALYRFDLRTRAWGIVEMHEDGVVPMSERTSVISNVYYPHHDPRRAAPPHGWLNGPNGCAVVGDWIYAVGKDNHTLARYDLTEIRRNPHAGAPASEFVLGESARVRVLGVEQDMPLRGHSAVAADSRWLYLATRTNSVVVRFPIDERGDLVRPIVGELIAEFEPFTVESGRSADVWDMVVGPDGDVYVSCARAGRIWRFTPDPAHPFDGNDFRKDPPTPNRPWLDGPTLTGAKNARLSNMTFDAEGRMLVCATFTESHTDRAGAVFRVREIPPER